MGEIIISKQEIEELAKLTNEINDRIESLELMGDNEFMDSFKKSKEQIEKKEFADWNEL